MAKKIAYLTIDDAPSADLKRKVDFLLSKGIPAICFCNGNSLEKGTEFAIYAIEKGFVLGNHAYEHLHFSRIPLKKCFDQIKRTDEIIEEVYNEAGRKRPAKLFRFPFGDKGGGTIYPYVGRARKEKTLPKQEKPKVKAIQNFLRRLGYGQPRFEGITYQWFNDANLSNDADVYWTYDVMDWTMLKEKPTYGIWGLKKILERMDEDAPEGGKGLNFSGSSDIVLVHDFIKTVDMFLPILDKLIAKNMEFKLPKF